jgi:prepilin-type N-terminal cleavage/methylation domain-containing protein
MRRGPRPAGRAGFTLIELLVVISILALLAALVAAGISKVKEAQQGRTTDQTLTKLQLALDKQWKAICDQCRDDRRNKADAYTSLLSFCDNDAERAEALWMYINLRRDLPQTYSEARGDLCPNVAQRNGTAPFASPDNRRGTWLWYPMVSTTAAVYVAPPRSTYNSVPATDVGTVDQMSAVLLYLILTERGTRGSNFSADDAMQGAQVAINVGSPTGPQYQVFKDAFGSPISFVRYFQHPELNQPPYVRANLVITDALDPVGRLGLWVNNPKMKAAEQAAGTLFNGKNRLATVYSLGANQTADRDGLGALNPLGESDDHFGYRIVRQGNKGD